MTNWWENGCVCVLSCFSCVRLFVTLWAVGCRAPLSMGFSRQGHWSGLPCPSPGYLPNPGVEPESLMPSALTGGFFTTNAAWEGNKGYLRGRCLSGCCGGWGVRSRGQGEPWWPGPTLCNSRTVLGQLRPLERREKGPEQRGCSPWCRSHRVEVEMTRRPSTRRAGPHPHGPPQRVCLAGALEKMLSTDALCAERGGRPWEKPDLGSRALARWFQNHTGKTSLKQKFPCW